MEFEDYAKSDVITLDEIIKGEKMTTAQPEITPEVKHLHKITAAECYKMPVPNRWLIKGLIPAKTIGMMFGKSGSGKSFLAYDMALTIASPEISAWNGRDVKHGKVILFAGEGVIGVRQRVAGWIAKRAVNPETVELSIIDNSFKLNGYDEDYNTNKIIDEIKFICNGDKPALVIFDTLNCYLEGDENSARDTRKYLDACSRISQELGCTVLTIHHTGNAEDARNRARGSSALRGAMDFEIQVEKPEDSKYLKIKCTKMKDAEPFKPMTFTLEQMSILDWVDEDGEQVTTCTIEYNAEITQRNEAEAAEQRRQKAIKIPKPEQDGKRSFVEAVRRYGTQVKLKNGEEGIGVTRGNLRQIIIDTEAFEGNVNDKNDDKTQRNIRARLKTRVDALTKNKTLLKINRETIPGEEFYYLPLSTPEREFLAECQIALRTRQETPQQDTTIPFPF